MDLSELVVGTVCGGSDGTSGITGNPAVGVAFDRLVDAASLRADAERSLAEAARFLSITPDNEPPGAFPW